MAAEQTIHRLEARCLRKCYGRKVAVDDATLSVTSGEVVGLLGTNGAGKTTCFDMIVGLLRADGGDVFLDGRRLTDKAMHTRAHAGIGYLPQEASIFRGMTSEGNLLAVLELRRDLNRRQRRLLLEQLISEFHLQGVRTSLGTQLSGGERRRVEFARALALGPSFLLLDEPFAGVDPITVSTVKAQIRLMASRRVGVLMTDHNARDTLEVCDRAYIMHRGRILTEGTPEALVGNEEVRRIYLGRRFSM